MNIIPSYRCNFQCEFCYIPKMETYDVMDLDLLKHTLHHLPQMDEIHILGGEPTLLPEHYQKMLIDICTDKLHGAKPKIYTNLSKIPIFKDRLNIMVSYDPCNRANQHSVLNNMLSLDNFQINMLLTKTLIQEYRSKLISLVKNLNMLTMLRLSTYTHFPGSVDLTPDPTELIEFITFIIKHNYDNKITFYPIDSIKNNYIKKYDPIQITEILPNMKFRIPTIYSTTNDFNSFNEAEKFYYSNSKETDIECIQCEFIGKCIKKYKKNTNCYWDKKIMYHIIKELNV